MTQDRTTTHRPDCPKPIPQRARIDDTTVSRCPSCGATHTTKETSR